MNTLDPSTTHTSDDDTFVIEGDEVNPGQSIPGLRLNRAISVTKRLTRPFRSGETGVEIYTAIPGTSPPEKGAFRFRVRTELACYLNLN